MKKLFVIMLMCICLFLTACKSSPNVIQEENSAEPSETIQGSDSQYEQKEDTSTVSQQNTEEDKKEENLLPDEKPPISEKIQEEQTSQLVPTENGVIRREADYDGLTTQVLTSAEYLPYYNLDAYMEKFNLEDCIIFKGVKKKNSTSVCSVNGGRLSDWYTETPIEVVDAYYGNIKPGDEIMLEEMAVLLGEGKTQRVGIDSSTKLVKKGSEYIFLLARSQRLTESKKQMYSYVSMGYSINEITAAHKKVSAYTDELGKNQFFKDVYTKYYYEVDKLDRKLDVKKETEKLYAKNGINELTDSQKELIDRLSKQYGAK